MVNFHTDQAEGLRRMLGGRRPRIFTFISTLDGDDKALMLNNLCSSLASAGSEVLLLDACKPKKRRGNASRKDRMTLSDVMSGRVDLAEVIEDAAEGFSRVALCQAEIHAAPDDVRHGLEAVFLDLVAEKGAIIIDSEIDGEHAFPMQCMSEGDIVVQVTPDAASIKNAYGMIKQLSSQLGRRTFGILVTGASEAQADKVFQNMSAAAKRYLAVPLELIGSIPVDDHVRRAAGLGRSVTDAFPLAGASVAFRRLAQRFSLPDSWHEASRPY